MISKIATRQIWSSSFSVDSFLNIRVSFCPKEGDYRRRGGHMTAGVYQSAVSKITERFMNRFELTFQIVLLVSQGTDDYILGMFWNPEVL